MENFHATLDSSGDDPGCLYEVETPLWQQGAREPGGRSVSRGTVGRGPRCMIRSVEGHDPYRCGHCAAAHASTAASSSGNIQTYTGSDMLLQVVLTVETYLRALHSSSRVSLQ